MASPRIPRQTRRQICKFSFRCYDIDDLNWDMVNIDGGGEGVDGDHFRSALLIAVVRPVSFTFHIVRNAYKFENKLANYM